MNKKLAVITILCIVLGMSLVYVTAYTLCGEELVFTAEGEFERVLVKSTWRPKTYGRIYEDGGSFSYLTGLKPRNVIFQVVVYTSNNTYFGSIYTLIIGSATSEIGGVQITVESRFEAVGTINSFEIPMIVWLGFSLGMGLTWLTKSIKHFWDKDRPKGYQLDYMGALLGLGIVLSLAASIFRALGGDVLMSSVLTSWGLHWPSVPLLAS